MKLQTDYVKLITSKLLAFGVALHSRAISLHVQAHVRMTEQAALRRMRAQADLEMAQQVLHNAIDAETEAMVAEGAATASARYEIEALPSVTGYGRVRTDPPFGARPQVIDKRK